MLLRLLTALLAMVSVSCGDHDPPKVSSTSTSRPEGQWYAGDFHVHTSVGSNDTRYPDGSARSFPELIRSTAVERGMAFVALTDHSNSAGSGVASTAEDADLWNRGPEFPLWETAAALSSPDFLMVDASEISPVSTLNAQDCPNCPTLGTGRLTPTGHIGCIPERLDAFDLSGAFVDRPPGQVTGAASIDQCHARGGFAVVNHPFYRSTPWIDFDWTSYDYDAIEVFNGSVGFASFDRAAYDAYLCDRLAGRRVTAVGGSDNHRTPLPFDEPISTSAGPPLGVPMTSVYAPRLQWDAIMRAVRQGHVIIHERDTFVDIDITDAAGRYLAGVGDRITAPAAAPVTRLRGRSPRTQTLRLLYVAPGACTERRQVGRDLSPSVVFSAVLERTVCNAGACRFDESLQIELAPGLYYATVGDFASATIGVRDVAVTNTIEVVRP